MKAQKQDGEQEEVKRTTEEERELEELRLELIQVSSLANDLNLFLMKTAISPVYKCLLPRVYVAYLQNFCRTI